MYGIASPRVGGVSPQPVFHGVMRPWVSRRERIAMVWWASMPTPRDQTSVMGSAPAETM